MILHKVHKDVEALLGKTVRHIEVDGSGFEIAFTDWSSISGAIRTVDGKAEIRHIVWESDGIHYPNQAEAKT